LGCCLGVVRSVPLPRVCYGELGCFDSQPPFNNTEGVLPQSPEEIQTTFRLFTSTCSPVPRVLHQNYTNSMSACDFNPSVPMKVIIHGFLQHGQVDWIGEMTRALMAKEPMSVITVDWGTGAGFPYSRAAANTRVVGSQLGALLKALHEKLGLHMDNVHIIGHSLGAHIAGYVSQLCDACRNVGRITGLDPAQPAFKDTPSVVHLDKQDAQFVDVIHTDGSEFNYVSGYGWIQEVGHVDFYPNGGMDQPGCPTESVGGFVSAAYKEGLNGAEDELSCSHSRAIFLFTESILSTCAFYGHPCSSLEALDMNAASCLRCPLGVCPRMGYHADKTPKARGKYFLRTRGTTPYCGQSQHLTIEFGNMPSTSGVVTVEMVGRDQKTDSVSFNSDTYNPFQSGERRDVYTVDREILDDVTAVRVTYVRPTSYRWWWSSGNATPYSVSISMVTVTTADDGRSVHFCGDHRRISNGNTIRLDRLTTDPNQCLYAPILSGQ
ncbi:hypothetical protein DPMN_084648, partial [Dreissena polymorpha]